MKRLFVFFIFLVFVLVSCEPDEINNDDVIHVSDLTGTWMCQEYSKLNGSSGFSVKISSDTLTSSGAMYIENFYHGGFDEKVSATLSGSTITIANQYFCDDFTVRGKGTVDHLKKISFVYYVNTGSDLDTVSAVFSR